jgi:ribosomal protein S18 acetylase RimI-like enzyme
MADLAWVATAAEREAAGRFLAAAVKDDARYISHGEIQCGLSPDGRRWADDLGTLLAEDMAGIGDDRSVLVARGATAAIVGVAIVFWVATPRVRYAVLEDLAVAPAMRSHGLGERMTDAVAAEARSRGAAWLFLESGRDNHRAHDFFTRHGFTEMSRVFARRLDA